MAYITNEENFRTYEKESSAFTSYFIRIFFSHGRPDDLALGRMKPVERRVEVRNRLFEEIQQKEFSFLRNENGTNLSSDLRLGVKFGVKKRLKRLLLSKSNMNEELETLSGKRVVVNNGNRYFVCRFHSAENGHYWFDNAYEISGLDVGVNLSLQPIDGGRFADGDIILSEGKAYTLKATSTFRAVTSP